MKRFIALMGVVAMLVAIPYTQIAAAKPGNSTLCVSGKFRGDEGRTIPMPGGCGLGTLCARLLASGVAGQSYPGGPVGSACTIVFRP